MAIFYVANCWSAAGVKLLGEMRGVPSGGALWKMLPLDGSRKRWQFDVENVWGNRETAGKHNMSPQFLFQICVSLWYSHLRLSLDETMKTMVISNGRGGSSPSCWLRVAKILEISMPGTGALGSQHLWERFYRSICKIYWSMDQNRRPWDSLKITSCLVLINRSIPGYPNGWIHAVQSRQPPAIKGMSPVVVW